VCVLWARGLAATRDRLSVGWAGGALVVAGSEVGRVSLIVVRRWPHGQKGVGSHFGG